MRTLIGELTYGGYHAAAACLGDDLDALLVHLKYPDAASAEQHLVPRLLSLAQAGGAKRRRMPNGHRDKVVDVLAGERRQHPGDRGIPVVPYEVGSLHAGIADHCHDVPDERPHPVGARLSRLRRAAEAAQIGNDHLKAG